MAHVFLKIRPLSVIFATMLAGTCAPVSQNPSIIANRSNESAATSTSSVSDLNRNIAAAALIQSSASSSDYQVGPEDLLEITLFNIPEAALTERHLTPRTQTVRVSHRGQISLPLVGEIAVLGLTVSGLEEKLREHYDKYIHNPQISVLVKEFRQRVSIIGAVQKPGVFELLGPKSVIDMLALAGGVTERAGNQVHVYRQDNHGDRQSIVIDLMMLANSTGVSADAKNAVVLNAPLQSGDVVNVPQAGTFFVDGAVGKPGSYALARNYTLSQALAVAGGVNTELADYGGVTINRRQGASKMEIIPTDLDMVMAGKTEDPQIQPDDVILVPMSSFKYFVKRFVGTIVSGVSIGSFIGSGS
jgi:polysaccharide export outer membrane protein